MAWHAGYQKTLESVLSKDDRGLAGLLVHWTSIVRRFYSGVGQHAVTKGFKIVPHGAILGAGAHPRAFVLQVLQATPDSQIDCPDLLGFTTLAHAVASSDRDLVEALLVRGADASLPSGPFQSTPLHVAAAKGADDIIDMLLKHGANALATDKLDRRPDQVYSGRLIQNTNFNFDGSDGSGGDGSGGSSSSSPFDPPRAAAAAGAASIALGVGPQNNTTTPATTTTATMATTRNPNPEGPTTDGIVDSDVSRGSSGSGGSGGGANDNSLKAAIQAKRLALWNEHGFIPRRSATSAAAAHTVGPSPQETGGSRDSSGEATTGDESNGGWRPVAEQGHHRAPPANLPRCSSVFPTLAPDDPPRKFLPFLTGHTPVIIVNGTMQWPLRQHLTRSKLAQTHGSASVLRGHIPYAKSFGGGGHQSTLSDFLAYMDDVAHITPPAPAPASRTYVPPPSPSSPSPPQALQTPQIPQASSPVQEGREGAQAPMEAISASGADENGTGASNAAAAHAAGANMKHGTGASSGTISSARNDGVDNGNCDGSGGGGGGGGGSGGSGGDYNVFNQSRRIGLDYVFDTNFVPKQLGTMKDLFPLPPVMAPLGRLMRKVKTQYQFFLGSATTGAPFHYHTTAVNGVVFGLKQCM